MNYKLRIKKQKKSGYLLLETMISVALFSIVIMAGMGALLNANRLHNKSKDMRSILDNLSFSMDDMSKNIRTGYDYYCIPNGNNPIFPIPAVPSVWSGQNCIGIEFEPAGGGSPWAYLLNPAQGTISRTTDGGATWVVLTPTEAVITNSVFPFSVLGAEPPPDLANGQLGNDYQQPLVNIRLVGSILYQNNVNSPFSLQTSVSQMGIDI
jgi:type II secretory pathway pseudopilin PulG